MAKMRQGAEADRSSREGPFAHPSEAEVARLLDFYGIRWQYEPTTFSLLEDKDGNTTVGFSPDFYLPDFNLYIELTTKKTHLMKRKMRQIEALRRRHPGVQVKLLDRGDLDLLIKKLQGRRSGNISSVK